MGNQVSFEEFSLADELFKSRVVVKPSGCWEWTGYCLPPPNLYGIVGRRGKTMKAHRYSYSISIGPIPKDSNVLHECDNPPCVNPNHLFLGTQADNVRDMAKKGRHGMSSLSNDQVAEIRRRVADGEVQRTLSVEFGVRPPCISRIVSGKRRA